MEQEQDGRPEQDRFVIEVESGRVLVIDTEVSIDGRVYSVTDGPDRLLVAIAIRDRLNEAYGRYSAHCRADDHLLAARGSAPPTPPLAEEESAIDALWLELRKPDVNRRRAMLLLAQIEDSMRAGRQAEPLVDESVPAVGQGTPAPAGTAEGRSGAPGITCSTCGLPMAQSVDWCTGMP